MSLTPALAEVAMGLSGQPLLGRLLLGGLGGLLDRGPLLGRGVLLLLLGRLLGCLLLVGRRLTHLLGRLLGRLLRIPGRKPLCVERVVLATMLQYSHMWV